VTGKRVQVRRGGCDKVGWNPDGRLPKAAEGGPPSGTLR